jgi:mono/diheme cytochrome c family protein
MKRTGAVLVIAVLAAALAAWAQDASSPKPASLAVTGTKTASSPTSFLQAPSWLAHLKLTVAETRMGQMGGTDPIAKNRAPEIVKASASNSLNAVMQRFLSTFRSGPDKSAQLLSESFPVTGADLYRWNCQSCHGPDGKGAPPEINSLLGPVQGTSPVLLKARMEARGIEADDEMAAQAADMAATSLRDRLRFGGKSMPAFGYLNADEFEALLGYLEKLAQVPGSKRGGLVVQESARRVGEHILRGTCQICHDGTGPGNGQVAMTKGLIPSLTSIPREQSLSGVVHQVQYGSASMMKLTGGPVMPAYPYFTEEEIAAAYLAASSARP